ncbi:MAG: aldehyde ferredoxin oxidoreductase N-terminal domain-containing protein [Desulfovibrio sp.]
MIRDHFRVMVVDLSSGKTRIEQMDGRNEYIGGCGLAAMLYMKYGQPEKPWNDPDQPFILAIGPLTGYFPLMSKTVCAFKSPYHDQYAESYAGGRSALSMRFANMDALVIIGKADRLSALSVGSRSVQIKDVHFLRNADVFATGKTLRRMYSDSGHRTILRVGPAAEKGSAYACINVDSFRHFGRLGAGTVMAAKNIKGITILGDGNFDLLPSGRDGASSSFDAKQYNMLFKDVYTKLTSTKMMSKYHDLGTAGNMKSLNTIEALPWRNLQQTTDPEIDKISGETFADETLLRNTACSGCPVGCVHIGYVREKFMEENQYLFRQVAYDYEPLFSTGSMLGVTDPSQILTIMDTVEQVGLDVMSAGVALAWATEALEKGLVTTEDTIEELKFGDADAYVQGILHISNQTTEMYKLLAQGTMHAAKAYGGEDFACVLGQEMAGYATGEVFFVSEALGFRHAHLDSGGYAYDQKNDQQDVQKAIDFLVEDEAGRVMMNSLVSCLFARGIYTTELIGAALDSLGYTDIAADQDELKFKIQQARWKVRMSTGYDPGSVRIPKRYTEVETRRGPIDANYMEALRVEYARRIEEMGAPDKS